MEANLTAAARSAQAGPRAARSSQGTALPLFIALGVVFWFAAAMVVRFAGPAVFSEHNPRLAGFFLLGFPITYGFLFITRHVGKVRYTAMLRPVVVMTLTAAFLDGVALAWFRQLYGSTFEVALLGAAWILWGVGIGLLAAFVLDSRGAAS